MNELPRRLGGREYIHLQVQGTWLRPLGRADLEKEMAAHSSILAWEIP